MTSPETSRAEVPRPRARANQRAFEVELIGPTGVSHTVLVFARNAQAALAGASENLHTCGVFITRDADGNVWSLRRVRQAVNGAAIKTKQG